MKLLLTTTQLFAKAVTIYAKIIPNTFKLYINQTHNLFKNSIDCLVRLDDAYKSPLLGLTFISFKWNTFCK